MTIRWCGALFALAVVFAGFSSGAIAADKSRGVTPEENPGLWFAPQDYPAESKRAGEQGKVTVKLSIDRDGRPVDCRTTFSSGHPRLDSGTCAVAMRRARFKPALDENGNAIASTYVLPGIMWFEQDYADVSSGPNDYISIAALVDVDSSGRVIRCSPVAASASDAQVCAKYKIGDQASPRLVKDGKPVAGRITVTSSFRIEARP